MPLIPTNQPINTCNTTHTPAMAILKGISHMPAMGILFF